MSSLLKSIFTRRKNHTMDAQIQEEIHMRMQKAKEKEIRMIRIVLLGTGVSSKSTIFKQLAKVHCKNYWPLSCDVDSLTLSIKHSIVCYMKLLCFQSQRLHDMYKADTLISDNRIRRLRDNILSLESSHASYASVNAETIQTLWNTNAIQETLRLKHHYFIDDNAAYFLDKADDILRDNYVLSFEDYLRYRHRTIGYIERQLSLSNSIDEYKPYTFELIDTGGERSKRKKWTSLSDGSNVIIYCVAIGDYDLNLFEDASTNRLCESLQLFQTLAQNKWFTNKMLYIFFTKWDVFKEKIRTVPITVALNDFPTESKDPNDETDVARFIDTKFMQILDDNTWSNDHLHIFRLNALDIHPSWTERILEDCIHNVFPQSQSVVSRKIQSFVFDYVDKVRKNQYSDHELVVPEGIIKLLVEYIGLCMFCMGIDTLDENVVQCL
eukprot:167024_1